MRTLLNSLLAAALLAAALLAAALLATTASAASPKIGCAAEIGAPTGTSRNWALVMLKLIDSAEAHEAYRVYWKAGTANSPNPYTLLATLRPMVSPSSLTLLLNNAHQAGVDLPSFEARLDGILNGQEVGPSLAEKLSFLVQAESDSDLLKFQIEVLANSHPVMAAALGRAYFAAIPDGGPSTFEVRAFDSATQLDGPVVGRPTVQDTPEWLPAPDCLTERPEQSQKGHLRVQLRWCYPLALRHKFLHFGGTRVIRAPHAGWQAAFGVNPPLNINRTNLQQAIADGYAVPVNGLPLFPEERPNDALDPTYQLPLFTDDNDSAAASSFTSGVPFVAGDDYTYWIWEEDLFGRPGHPSQGTSITVCDRIAPDPPIGLTALNERLFTGGSAHDLIRLEWPTASSLEVRRWYLYCSPEVNDLVEAYASDPDPNVPGQLVAVIDNDGSRETPDGERISFLHDGTAPVPLPGPGETVYYRLRAEDDPPCKIGDLGNVSGPSGPVPASNHDHNGATPTGAWLEVPCCNIIVGYQALPGENDRPYTAILRALRPSEGFQWVEFQDDQGFIGRYEFGPGQNQIQVPYQPGDDSARTFGARFGHRGGLVSPWRNAGSPDAIPYDLHVFQPRWDCTPIPPLPTSPRPNPPQRCPGFLPPINPETGQPTEVCVRFANLGGNLKSWIVYKQFGIGGEKTKLADGVVTSSDPPVLEVCDGNFPPGGGEICYYVQGATTGGNLGPMELAGCVKVAPQEGLPTPTITTTQPSIEVDPTASSDEHNIGWFSPLSAERFEIAFCPAPAITDGASFSNFDAQGRLCKWGTVETPRTATGWGQSEFEFLSRLELVEGVNYRCKVRAVNGHGDERDHGAWSEVKSLHWLNQPAQLPEVPWPMRDAPGITGKAFMEWDSEDCILRVAIGELLVTTYAPTLPLPADTMEPYLYYDLPMVAYLRETGPDATGKMLQVSRYLDEILTTSPGPGTGPITLDDDAVQVSTSAGPPWLLWLRIDQAVLSGRTYEVFLVMHNPNGEVREVLRTNPVQVPTLLQISQ